MRRRKQAREARLAQEQVSASDACVCMHARGLASTPRATPTNRVLVSTRTNRQKQRKPTRAPAQPVDATLPHSPTPLGALSLTCAPALPPGGFSLSLSRCLSLCLALSLSLSLLCSLSLFLARALSLSKEGRGCSTKTVNFPSLTTMTGVLLLLPLHSVCAVCSRGRGIPRFHMAVPLLTQLHRVCI